LRFFNLVTGLALLTANCYAADGLFDLTRNIPTPPERHLTGSRFAVSINDIDPRVRERVILQAFLNGEMPEFLKKLVPVKLSALDRGGQPMSATIFVMPEYLAIGSDADFLRIPMNLYTAAAVATHLGFILPTRKIVDAIYQQSAFHFAPAPMQAGPLMRTTEYYREHNQMIQEQFRHLGASIGALISGQKKDVVVSNLLAKNPGHIAIYGWHRTNGSPIQPLTTVHGACYADYSHGIRLVSETVLLNGEKRSIYDLLADPIFSGLLSDEGPIPGLRGLMQRSAESVCGPA
jgi:hypothetical protein